MVVAPNRWGEGGLMTTYLVGVHIDDHTLTQYDLLLRLLNADLWETGRIMARSRHLFRQLRLRRGRFGTEPASLGCRNNRVLSLEFIEVMPIRMNVMSVLRLQFRGASVDEVVRMILTHQRTHAGPCYAQTDPALAT
jgi:hypothetical protein